MINGIFPHLLGYYYVRFAVIQGLQDPNFFRNLSAICYPKIAKEFQTSERCVERAIRHAIDRSVAKCSEGALPRGKRTNREFLVMFTEHIRELLD